MIIAVGALIALALCVYVYYSLSDSEEAPVSKEELGYVALCSAIASVAGGALVYVMMVMEKDIVRSTSPMTY